MNSYTKKSLFNFLTFFLFVFSFFLSQAHCELSRLDQYHTRNNAQKVNSEYPAAISFFVVDLKYNHAQGVQVCEIQPSVISKFAGFDFVNSKRGAAAEKFCDYVSTLQDNLWYGYGRITDKSFVQAFIERNWKSEKIDSKLGTNLEFSAAMSQPVYDPFDIHNFHGLLYTRVSKMKSLKEFIQKFPGIMMIDAATYKYGGDKYIINKLLTDDELLRQLKPAWNLYTKKYSTKLVEQIKSDLGSEMFVIKPRRATLGKGVIIVDKANLATALKKMMGKSNDLGKKGSDDPYNYWKRDRSDSFLVEAFVPSETVYASHLDDMPYDPTMRVGVVLVYSQGKVDVHFIACYWKLPVKSLSKKGSLNEIHRSCGKIPYFAEVSQEIQQKVEKQLSETLPHMFEIMLGHF